ncbi:MAG: DNA/RNA nuclease SfsA [Rickettsiales bacterium]|nr:DNA/RNA nuclease SfsA [Rickettsiales bacterium]
MNTKADKTLIFPQSLQEGVIVKRPNRFLMDVIVNNKVETCHCPCTGKIGNIVFDTEIPCLLSFDDTNKNRKTKYTVEAISLNNVDDKSKKWIGINQVKANGYVEFFLKTNQLKNIVSVDKNTIIQREKYLGNSKIDFLINDSFLEVKSPLVKLELNDDYYTNKKVKIRNNNDFHSTDRFMKHLVELTQSIQTHQKAYLITFFMFEFNTFDPPHSKNFDEVYKTVKKAQEAGVELWKVNCIFEKDGINLSNYSRIFF